MPVSGSRLLTMMSLCCTSCSWEMSCCCCSCSWCRAGEDLARSDCSRWVCCTKFTCSCSCNNQSEVSIGSSINQSQLTCSCGTSCSSCLRPASAPCWTSCCSCAGWRLEKGELCTNQRRVLSATNQSELTCSSWCICCSPGGSRGSCSAGAGDTRPDSESLQQKIFYRI